MAGVLVLALAATLGGVLNGPALGDHETLVAQCARTIRVSGDWLVPRFMGIPWIRKPPLPYWLVAAASYLFPDDPATGLPVTPAAARLPSALAGLGSILLLWRLSGSMFGRRAGLVTAVIASSTILFLKYSPDATAEMPLTFCCIWAYLHFWYAVTAGQASRRHLHLLLFYLALGAGMMVKGPAPVAMVGLPLAVWWYTHHPLRHIARSGRRAWRHASISFVRGLGPRTAQAFTHLWLIPGLILFAAAFVPWMYAVAQPTRAPHALDEWKWQYVMRAQGDYLDSRDRRAWYYLPYIIGMTAPWLFLLPEAAAAPWLRRYARLHRPLLYAGLWALVAITVMSLEPFKKPYYILPAVPALFLMMGAVADRFYSQELQSRGLFWVIWAAATVAIGATVVGLSLWIHRSWPAVSDRLIPLLAGVTVLLLLAAALHLRGRAWVSMGLIAVTTVAAFQVGWHTAGPALDNLDRVAALAERLERAKVPHDATLLWADGRPDSRLEFYFGRRSGYMIRPEELVSDIQDRVADKQDMELMALRRAQLLMEGSETVYLIWERKNFERARDYSGLRGQVIVEVSRGDDGEKDWVVITNANKPGSS